MKKVSCTSSIRFTEYTDGTGRLEIFRFDPTTRKVVPEYLCHVDMGGVHPPTVLEALFIGAAEALGRDLYGFDQLP